MRSRDRAGQRDAEHTDDAAVRRAPADLGVARVLWLQQGAGNAAVARLLAREPVVAGAPAGVAPAAPDGGAASAPAAPAATVAAPPVTDADDFDLSPLVAGGLEAEDMARLRDIYKEGAKQIAEEAKAMQAAAKGDPVRLQQIADWAVNARNELKAKIRDEGSKIVKLIAEARNMKKYKGNKLGPSPEGLRAKGLTNDQIVESAARSDVATSRWAGRLRIAGRIMIAIDLGVAGYRIYHAETNRPQVIGQEVGGIAGALGGGAVGAKGGAWVGGAIGAWFGGAGAVPGAAIGAFVGGIGGAIAGGLAGREAGGWVADQLYPPGQTEFTGTFSTE